MTKKKTISKKVAKPKAKKVKKPVKVIKKDIAKKIKETKQIVENQNTSQEKRTREQLEKILTEREKAFCWRYVVLRNGGRAAREAGYSEKTAIEIAHQNLLKLHIKEYLALIKDCIEEATGVNRFRQVEELAKIAYLSFEDINDSWIELKDWEIIKEKNPSVLSAIESIDTKTETRTTHVNENTDIDIETKYVKVKFHSKISAIVEINKMFGYNAPDKIDLSNTDGSLSMTKEQREQKIKELTNKLNAK